METSFTVPSAGGGNPTSQSHIVRQTRRLEQQERELIEQTEGDADTSAAPMPAAPAGAGDASVQSDRQDETNGGARAPALRVATAKDDCAITTAGGTCATSVVASIPTTPIDSYA